MFNEFDEPEELDFPKFECRVVIPDEITGGTRMLIQQVDILRQHIEWVHKKGTMGRRAWVLAKKNEIDITRLMRIYYIGTGLLIAFELYLRIGLAK